MNKRILIIGGVAGGASAAARLRRLNEQDTIIMFERGEHVSFSNCSLPYYLSDTIDNAERLIMMSPEKFKRQYNIEARTNTEVIAINREEKTITIKNLIDHSNYIEHYDILILSPGAKPITPPIPGSELVNIHTVRNVQDIIQLKTAVTKDLQQNIAVIGGGFIGIEVAENLKEASFNVSLIEAMPQILSTVDYDLVQILHKAITDYGINLIINDKVIQFNKNQIQLSSGRVVNADIVIMAIGVEPEVNLAKDAGLNLGETGAIAVNEFCQTNDPSIYAIGDAIEVNHLFFTNKFKLALAWPAQIQARGIANYINQREFINPSYIGTSCIKIFDYNAASTGLTEGMIKNLKLPFVYDIVHITPNDKVSLMPTSQTMHFKLIFERSSGKILGAQAIGKGNVDKRIDVIATAIKFNATVMDLPDLELCYAPPFNTAKDVVNMAGYVACNLWNGDFKQVNITQVRDLVNSEAYILDVRESIELQKGAITNSINIPLSELRTRISEIPHDTNIYIHCRSGQRSYNAALLLKNLGFTKVYNIAGGFLSLSYFEFYNDKILQRQPILTGYNFN